MLTLVPRAVGPPISVGQPVPGNKRGGTLVDRQGQHPGVVPERRLDTIAVVDVDIDVGDPLDTRVKQPLDRHRQVVVHAEARRPVGHRVVQATGDVDRVLGLAAVYTARAAATVAPHTRAAAVCMSGNTGVSAVPSPNRRSLYDWSSPPRLTASMSSGVCTRSRTSSETTGISVLTCTCSASSRPNSRIKPPGQFDPHGAQRVPGSEVVGTQRVRPRHDNLIAHDQAPSSSERSRAASRAARNAARTPCDSRRRSAAAVVPPGLVTCSRSTVGC